MEQVYVDEEKICFSSARNMFEKAPQTNKPVKAKIYSNHQCSSAISNNKDTNHSYKESTVVSTATLKRQLKAPVTNIDDNINNSNNVSTTDRKTEISVIKAIRTPSKQSGSEMVAKNSTLLRATDERNGSNRGSSQENSVAQEHKKTVSFHDERKGPPQSTATLNNTRAPSGESSMPKKQTQSSHRPEDPRQLLMNDILNSAGRTLRSVPIPQERRVLFNHDESHLNRAAFPGESTAIPPAQNKIPQNSQKPETTSFFASGDTFEPKNVVQGNLPPGPKPSAGLSQSQKKMPQSSSKPEDARQLLMHDIINASGRTLKSVPKPQEKSLDLKTQVALEPCTASQKGKTIEAPREATFEIRYAANPISDSSKNVQDNINFGSSLFDKNDLINAGSNVSSDPCNISALCFVRSNPKNGAREIITSESNPSSILKKEQQDTSSGLSRDAPSGSNVVQEGILSASNLNSSFNSSSSFIPSRVVSSNSGTTSDPRKITQMNMSGLNAFQRNLHSDSKGNNDVYKVTQRTDTSLNADKIPTFHHPSKLSKSQNITMTPEHYTLPLSNVVPVVSKPVSSPMDTTPVIAAPRYNIKKTSSVITKQDVFACDVEDDEAENKNDDRVNSRVFLNNWDPTKLLEKLYRVDVTEESSSAHGCSYLNKSGYMECLPVSKTKDTFLKTWKRKFFRAHGGYISFYEGSKEEKESGKLELGGGNVEDIGPRMLGIEDGRGHYLVVRCSSEKEAKEWKASIHSQTVGDVSTNWIKPIPGRMTSISESKRIVVIDVGSSSVRAGILDSSPSLPVIFFPNILATNLTNGRKVYGFDALKPGVRSSSTLSYPVRPSNKVDKYSLEWDSLHGLFEHVFNQLRLEPRQCSVLFSAPTSFNKQTRSKFMEMFFEKFNVRAVSMVSQTLLALYSYKVDTGIVVDAGEKIEILPVIDGFVVEGSVKRLPFGGQRMCNMFNSFLTGRKCRFSTDVELQLVKYAVEKLCYVSMDYKKDFDECLRSSQSYQKILSLDSFDLPPEAAEPITSDLACFRSAEGFFDMTAWGVDSPPLQQLIAKVISLCPIDSRRQMWRNIYLSGGITLLPNFKERLEAELTELTPPNVAVQVHASPYRYHASYLGACVLANMEAFNRSCITWEDWKLSERECVKRIAIY